MNRRAVIQALSTAISKTVLAELDRLTVHKTEQQKVDLIEQGRNQVFALQHLEMPKYGEEIVATVYAAAYQLQHINLTYSLIEDTLGYRNHRAIPLARNGKLQVVDFGAGALAMQFGLALAIADAIERKHSITDVRIDSFDVNEPTLAIGKKIWEEFTSIAANSDSSELALVSNACQLVSYDTHSRVDTISCMEGSESWLSAIHAVYGEKEGDIKRDLAQIYSRIRPIVGLITCYGNHDETKPQGNVGLVPKVSPFDLAQFGITKLAGYNEPGVVTSTPVLENRLLVNGWQQVASELLAINEEWGLINNPSHTQRKDNAVINWTWDTSCFTYSGNFETNIKTTINSTQQLPEQPSIPVLRITKLKPRWDVHLSGDDDQLGCAGESLSSVLGE